MKVYTHFIGIDIGKFTFVVAKHGKKITQEYENSASGIKAFLKTMLETLNMLCVS